MTNHKRRGGDLQRIQTSQRRGGGALPRTLLPRFKRRVAQLNAPLWSNLRWLQLRCHHLSKLIQWSCRQGLSQWLTQGFCQTYQPVLPLLGEPSLDLKISNSNGNVGDWCSTRMSPKRCGKIMLSVSSGPCVLLLGTMMLAWRNSLREKRSCTCCCSPGTQGQCKAEGKGHGQEAFHEDSWSWTWTWEGLSEKQTAL